MNNLDLQRNGHCPIDYEQTRLVGKLTQLKIITLKQNLAIKQWQELRKNIKNL